jgi:pimeloyl-ACP methyl ester carboxylesterase
MLAGAIFSVIVLLVAFALAARALAQWRHAQCMEPIGPNGIDERGFVDIGGIPQWVAIRGHDRVNPVLLVLHGGPGAALSAVSYALFARAERAFTVVHWDQRGAGRTFGRNGRRGSGEMSIARMTQDGIDVAAHLCSRLCKKRIVLCALSWGSVLALGMLTRRPDLFAAYVGTGQIVDMPAGERFAYQSVLAQAKRRVKRPAIAALEWIGPPPFGGGKARRIWQQWLLDFAPASERRAMREMPFLLLTAPRMGLCDVWDTLAGVIFSYAHLFEPLMAFRAAPYGTAFDVPMFFFQGSDDLQTPTRLVCDYAARIKAPAKDVVLLEGGGHMVIRTMGESFLEEMIARVRPVAVLSLESEAPQAGAGGAQFLKIRR